MEPATEALQNHNFSRSKASSQEHDSGTPLPTPEDLLAQQQFAQSVPVIEREGANPLWNRALQK